MALLEVERVVAGYGKIEILHGVSLALEQGTLCAIVGANGAGKTTLLRTISSIVPKRGGSVRFAGKDVTTMSPHAIVRRGLAHVPEGRRMLAHLTVEENLQIAAGIRRDSEIRTDIDAMFARFPILGTRRHLPSGSLSGGEQQMLAIARALVARPLALLLDEPSMGLAPKLVAEIFAIIREERARGASILLVEQNARAALALADRAYVLERGNVVLEGTGKELLERADVTAAYLGGA
ncbi:MAG TPA: ABC transporter ATP-binding protein [Candidatus Baltobacteraceae bacterium]|jgi:branched-chain amino acid transport system ATP-binding protein